MSKPMAIAGQKIGRLQVLELTPRLSGQSARTWRCQCDCGAVCQRTGQYLAWYLEAACCPACSIKASQEQCARNARRQKTARAIRALHQKRAEEKAAPPMQLTRRAFLEQRRQYLRERLRELEHETTGIAQSARALCEHDLERIDKELRCH